MANSNSKLSKVDKQIRKDLRALFLEQGGTLRSFPQYGVTVGIVPNAKEGDTRSKTATLYTSIASNDEQKFRRKVGEFHVLNRWDMGQGAIVNNPDAYICHADDFAEEIAATIWAAGSERRGADC